MSQPVAGALLCMVFKWNPCVLALLSVFIMGIYSEIILNEREPSR